MDCKRTAKSKITRRWLLSSLIAGASQSCHIPQLRYVGEITAASPKHDNLFIYELLPYSPSSWTMIAASIAEGEVCTRSSFVASFRQSP